MGKILWPKVYNTILTIKNTPRSSDDFSHIEAHFCGYQENFSALNEQSQFTLTAFSLFFSFNFQPGCGQIYNPGRKRMRNIANSNGNSFKL